MSAAITNSLTLDKLPVNWFDAAVLLVLGLGLFLGRKHGMTKEVLRGLQWVALVVVCGLFYEFAAQALVNITAWDKATSYVTGYLVLAFLVWIVFAVVKRVFIPRLTGSNIFGSAEYYLGMFSGMIRSACMLFFALALLNAPVYTQAEIAAHQAYVKRWYGGGIYGGNYIPDLQTVQESVFKRSFVGPYIKDYLGVLLINTEPPEAQKRPPNRAAWLRSSNNPRRRGVKFTRAVANWICRIRAPMLDRGMAGFFSSATLERIRAASDIVDVVGSYLPLKKAGANFVALCPFHKEKTPSFSVNPHRQIFHCFGCHKGGDVFTFVKEYENIGFGDAVRRLADRAKIPIEFDQKPGEQQSRHLKDQLLQIHEQIAQRWQNCLLNEAAGQTARDYLAKRGVPPEAVKLFRLGAAPEAWDDTVNWAKSKGHELALVEKAGLIIQKSEAGSQRSEHEVAKPDLRTPNSEPPAPGPRTPAPSPQPRNFYDRFRGRLMFPICDEQGRVIGFSGRVLAGDEKTAKYVNSPETPIFTKSKVFFGLDKSKRAILDAGFALVCEGQLDLIACFMGGVQNVVAPQGTAFTEQHARMLKRYVDEVVLCFDSDEAGQNAAVRSLDHLLASGLAVRVAVVPAPHDPDSFIKTNGGEAFRKLVENAEGFFDYYLKRLCEKNDFKTDKGRTVVVRSMLEALQKTGNRVAFDKYAHDLTFKLGLSFRLIVDEFQKLLDKPSPERREESPESEEATEAQRPSAPEFWLLKLLLLHDDLAAWAALHLEVNWIAHPVARQIVAHRLAAQTNETWKNVAALLDECETPEMRSLVTEAVAEDRTIPNTDQQLADVTLKLRNQFLDRQIGALTHKISQPDVSDSEKNELLREQQKLREQKRAPLK